MKPPQYGKFMDRWMESDGSKMKNKKYHTFRTNSNVKTIERPTPPTHDCSLLWLGTGTPMKMVELN
jgi:hypothetical protein